MFLLRLFILWTCNWGVLRLLLIFIFRRDYLILRHMDLWFYLIKKNLIYFNLKFLYKDLRVKFRVLHFKSFTKPLLQPPSCTLCKYSPHNFYFELFIQFLHNFSFYKNMKWRFYKLRRNCFVLYFCVISYSYTQMNYLNAFDKYSFNSSLCFVIC